MHEHQLPKSSTHSRLSQLGLRTNLRPPPTRPTSSTDSMVIQASTSDRQTWHQVLGLPARDSLASLTTVRDGGLLCVPVKDPENTTGGEQIRPITTSHWQMINHSTPSAHKRDSPMNHLRSARPSFPQLLSAPAGAKLWDGTLLEEIEMNHRTRTVGTMLVWGRGRTPSLVKSQHWVDQGRIASGLSSCQIYTCLWCALGPFIFQLGR